MSRERPAPTKHAYGHLYVNDHADLAEKYRLLGALRADRDRAGASRASSSVKATLRGLSERYPGCLRELDVLGGPEIARRMKAARAAAEGGPFEPWMSWISCYHRLL